MRATHYRWLALLASGRRPGTARTTRRIGLPVLLARAVADTPKFANDLAWRQAKLQRGN
jgi:hypothetical protein